MSKITLTGLALIVAGGLIAAAGSARAATPAEAAHLQAQANFYDTVQKYGAFTGVVPGREPIAAGQMMIAIDSGVRSAIDQGATCDQVQQNISQHLQEMENDPTIKTSATGRKVWPKVAKSWVEYATATCALVQEQIEEASK